MVIEATCNNAVDYSNTAGKYPILAVMEEN